MWWQGGNMKNHICFSITFSHFRSRFLQKIKFKFASFQESDNLGVVDFIFSNFFSVLFISDQVQIL
ncbi:hypothetical protein AAG906_007968 [Vitis piasezkii]|uniref:Uncharacterized protein n=1 Tax=Vitis vinifera TaxID=29760 RepID=A0A438DA03_VITVI|nr:hypothetical protein CK203_078971 [Vitis vinifera]